MPERPIGEMACVVCGAVNRTRWWMPEVAGADLALTSCRSCGHVYQCPQIDKGYADKFFSEAYGGDHQENSYFDPQVKLRHARELLVCLRSHCPDAQRILEVGAGIGAFVRAARDAGCQVLGTEMSEAGVRRAKETFDVDLFLGPLEKLPAQEPFDVVVLWDVIEHCPQPDGMLSAVRGRLRTGGKVVLTTANYENAARYASSKQWWCWHPDHYHYFTPAGIERLGRRHGFSDFVMARVPRIRGTSTGLVPSPLRFLNPLHVARALKIRALTRIARWRWPDRWDIGVMLCCMTRHDPPGSRESCSGGGPGAVDRRG